jgi:hypothetical protein
MSINIKSSYKIIFLIGLIFSFASVFLDWYYLEGVLDSGATIMSWVYNALFGWSTPFTEGNMFNESYKPQNATMPVVIVMVLIFAVFLSAYSALFHDVEKGDNLVKVKRFSFITLTLIVLIGFFVLIFPLFFLLPNDLYYPFMVYYDNELSLTLYYSIGPGYWCQVVSFGCIFPYTVFNQSVISTFEKEWYAPAEVIKSYLENVKERFDLDKLIAQEELEIESSQIKKQDEPKNEVEQIYEDFLATRGRK